jgi:transposase
MKANQAKPNPHCSPKLSKLTPTQQESLAGWLRDENMTYSAARERLFSEFGLKVSAHVLCKFWQKKCSLKPVEPSSQDSGVLLDVVIKSAGQVRLVVKKNGISLEY